MTVKCLIVARGGMCNALAECLAGVAATSCDDRSDPASALRHAVTAGADVLLVDETAIGSAEDALELVEACAARRGPMRVVFHGSRVPAGARFLFQLASVGHVDDIVLDQTEGYPLDAVRRAVLGQSGPYATSPWRTRDPELLGEFAEEERSRGGLLARILGR